MISLEVFQKVMVVVLLAHAFGHAIFAISIYRANLYATMPIRRALLFTLLVILAISSTMGLVARIDGENVNFLPLIMGRVCGVGFVWTLIFIHWRKIEPHLLTRSGRSGRAYYKFRDMD